MNDSEMKGYSIRIRDLKKTYRLGEIGGKTLQDELKRWWAKKRGFPDPLTMIGGEQRIEGDTILALNGVDLDVREGEALGIIGKNGAGKSTLLKLLCQITAPTVGEIAYKGRIASMLEVGIGFHGEMTGRENVYFNGAVLGMTKAEIDRKLPDIIAFSEIGEFIDTPVKRYSSGMFVKLAFSVAAHLESEILIMDEVLAVGDQDFQKKCLKKMREAAQVEGRTVLYVSHNMETIRRLCNRCIVLDEGRIIFDGDVDEAVSVYMGIQEELKTSFRYTEAFRPYGRFSHVFSIETLNVIGAEKPTFPECSHVRFRIGCLASEQLFEIRMRMELWYQDGTKVGSMLSNAIELVKLGDCEFLLEADLACLTVGQYSVDLVAYMADDDGNETILDGVYPGIVFNISEGEDTDHHVNWSHQYWGHVRLTDLRLEPFGDSKKTAKY